MFNFSQIYSNSWSH